MYETHHYIIITSTIYKGNGLLSVVEAIRIDVMLKHDRQRDIIVTLWNQSISFK